MIRIDEWLRMAAARLSEIGIESSRLEAQVLAAHLLGRDRSFVLSHPEQIIDADAAESLLVRRLTHEPLAYIGGHREFFGRSFQVSPAVLIPRQDTETLVECALAYEKNRPLKVLDVGTGSGILAITLKLECPHWQVAALEISEEALGIAIENAGALGADVTFVRSDLYETLNEEVFDLIVSNPPYIANDEILMPDVVGFEPKLALFSGATGLEFYARLAQESKPFLTDSGTLLVEIGYRQAASVTELFRRHEWEVSLPTQDLAGNDRVLSFHKCPSAVTSEFILP